MEKQKNRHILLYTKINSKWLVDLNVMRAATKLLGDNIREYHQGLRAEKDFLNRTKKKKKHKP